MRTLFKRMTFKHPRNFRKDTDGLFVEGYWRREKNAEDKTLPWPDENQVDPKFDMTITDSRNPPRNNMHTFSRFVKMPTLWKIQWILGILAPLERSNLLCEFVCSC